jgi:hypothetical protein
MALPGGSRRGSSAGDPPPAGLEPDGTLLAVHWRHPVADDQRLAPPVADIGRWT